MMTYPPIIASISCRGEGGRARPEAGAFEILMVGGTAFSKLAGFL